MHQSVTPACPVPSFCLVCCMTVASAGAAAAVVALAALPASAVAVAVWVTSKLRIAKSCDFRTNSKELLISLYFQRCCRICEL